MNKVDLTPAKLAELKDAAQSINPAYRSWYLNDYKRWVETYDNGDAIIVCHPEQIQPALSFIAEADPATVLAMVDEIERLRPAQCWVIMRKDNRDQVFDGPFFTEEEARLHVLDSVDHEYTVEPWVNQANVIESEAGQ